MTRQVALKLPDELLDRIDELVQNGRFESRSQAIRAGVEAVLANEAGRAIDEAFRLGFAAIPEDEAERAEALALGIAAIEEEPWERWW